MKRPQLVALLGSVTVLLAGCGSAAASTPAGTASGSCGGPTPTVAGLASDQASNAQAIAGVAQQLGAGQQGALVGITVALDESTLHNVNIGDTMSNGQMSSSRGLFQQLDAWGPLADRMDPTKSAQMFFNGGQAGQPGLLSIAGWQSMPVPQAAQAVQGSQFGSGSNYAAVLDQATQITTAILGSCSTTAPAAASSPSGMGAAIVAAVKTQLGMPYVWAGGGISGPSGIDSTDGRGPGFDCSGLVQWAVYTASGGKTVLPRTAAEQSTQGTGVAADLNQMQPGDLIAFNDGRVPGAGHIGVYIGSGQMIDAPQSRMNVQVDRIDAGFYSDRAQWIVRRM